MPTACSSNRPCHLLIRSRKQKNIIKQEKECSYRPAILSCEDPEPNKRQINAVKQEQKGLIPVCGLKTAIVSRNSRKAWLSTVRRPQ